MSTDAQSISLRIPDIECELASIWSALLDISAASIDPDANFFALGGDSLLILRVADLVRSRFFASHPDDAPGIPEFFSYGTLRSLATRLALALQVSAAPRVEAQSEIDSAVAIIGMACRFPGARDPQAFWRNLRDGVESIRVFRDSELLDAGVAASDLAHAAYVKAGVILEDVRLFDADYFGLTPREAALMSPEQRLVTECAEEALQDAGYADTRQAPRIGVFIGTGLSSYLVGLIAAGTGSLESSNGMALIASNTSAASRISYLLNLSGPSITIDTACSSSLVAVHAACQSILRGECEMTLAGGATVRRFAPQGYFAEPGGILSPDGHCRPFDRHAQGTVGSSGAGVVLLKRLTAALADRDTIHAVIRGTAVNNDAGTKAGYTAPSIAGQTSVIRAALSAAGVKPGSIHYVETHGTATLLGDAIELRALGDVFAASPDTKYPALGALKANVGHMEAAAGIGGLIKTVLVLKHRQIPPAIHFVDWATSADRPPFALSAELTELPSNALPLRAAVSSFGIGGTNAHAVLEEAPVAPARTPARQPELLVISAQTHSALLTSCHQLASRLGAAPAEELADIAYTLQVGRRQLPVRTHVVASSTADAARALESGLLPRRAGRMPVVFLFPDERAQYPGMGLCVYESEPRFKGFLDEMDRLLQSLTGRSVLGVLRGCGDEFAQDELAPAALFAVEYSLSRLWNAWGLMPSACFGRGVGEYVAACVSGRATPEDSLRLVIARGRTQLEESGSLVRDLLRGVPALLLEVGPGDLLCQQVRAESDADGFIPVPCMPAGRSAPDERRDLLSALGRVWENGAPVDWQAVSGASSCGRVSLPVYPFERREYWALPQSPPTPATPRQSHRLDISDWFNVATWEQRPVLLRAPRAVPAVGCYLLVGCWSELELQLREHLGNSGTRVVCVPRVEPERLTELFETLEREGVRSTRIVHCAEASSVADSAERPDEELLESGLYGLLDLCMTLAAVRCRPDSLILVTRGAHSVSGESAVSPRRAMLAPALEVIAREFPDVACRTIDIASDWPGEHLEQRAFRALMAEILAPSDDSLIALRGGRRWARTYRSAALPAIQQDDPLLREQGVYLITGGTGGIGWTFMRFLAQRFSARLIITARSGFPERDAWPRWLREHAPEDPLCARILEIQSLEANGARVIMACADVASVEQMQGVVALAVREFGRLDGVIHAAGVAGTGALHGKRRQSLDAVLRPKVMGTWALYEACKSQHLDFFVCCSSIASAITPAGWYEYSAASSFQDSFCEAHDGTTATRFVSIGWDRWKDVGMASRISGDSDAEAISPAEGIEVFRRLLATAAGARWIISTRPLPQLHEGTSSHFRARSPIPTDGVERMRAPEAAAPLARRPEGIEAELSRIWTELIGVQPVSSSDDFFGLGGDSLAAVDLHTRLEAHFGRAPPLRQLLTDPTLGAMAQLLRDTLTLSSWGR